MIKIFKKLNGSKKENAQTMVEFALVFPIILLITYGIIEFGRMVFIYAVVTGSAREGARYGAAAGVGANGYIQYADCAGIRSAVQKTAFLVNIPNGNILIHYDRGPVAAPGTPYIVSSTCELLRPKAGTKTDPIKMGDRIVVTVSAQYSPLIGNFLGVSGFTINSYNARTILAKINLEPYP
jgi:Flp pilus assembly protein TadG